MTPDPPASAETVLRSARSTSGRWPRSVLTQRSVLDAAGKLFAAKGYDSTSIDDIVKASGVSVGSIYHQFDGKADVFLALAAEELNSHLGASRGEMDRLRATGASAKQVYLAGAEAFLMSSWRHRQVSKVMIGDQGPPGYSALRRETQMRLSQEATRLRLVSDPPTADCAPMAVTALMNAATLQVVEVGSAARARKIVRYYIDLLAHLVLDEQVED